MNRLRVNSIHSVSPAPLSLVYLLFPVIIIRMQVARCFRWCVDVCWFINKCSLSLCLCRQFLFSIIIWTLVCCFLFTFQLKMCQRSLLLFMERLWELRCLSFYRIPMLAKIVAWNVHWPRTAPINMLLACRSWNHILRWVVFFFFYDCGLTRRFYNWCNWFD